MHRTPKRKGINRKMEADELMGMIKNAVTEALDTTEDEKEDLPPDELEPKEDPTEEEFETALQKAINSVMGKRKALSDAGEALSGDLTAEEIIAEMAAMVDSAAPEDEEEKSDDISGESTEERVIEAPSGEDYAKALVKLLARKAASRKSATAPLQRKSAPYTPPIQRKYASLFLSPPSDTHSTSTLNAEKQLPPHVQIARAVKCMYIGRGDVDRAAHYARKQYNDSRMEREFKALNTTSPTAGGYLIPEVYADQLIELLYNKTFLYELGALKMDMPNGTLTIHRMTRGSTAKWDGELRKIASTQPQYGDMKLSAKRLAAIVSMSREFLQHNSYSNDAVFGNDLTKAIQLGLEKAALFGVGGDFQPLGILNTNGTTRVDASTISDTRLVDGNQITAGLIPVIQSLAFEKNIYDDNLGWLFNSRVYGELMNAASPRGDYSYRYEMTTDKTLMGSKFRVTNQIPTASNKSTIIFGNWSDLIVGDAGGLEMVTTEQGIAHDDYGNEVNAFEQNAMLMRAILHADIGVKYPESFVVVDNVPLTYQV